MSKIFNEITTVVAVTLMLAAVSACGEKEFYNDEQYRKECYIVSGENNIFGQEYTYGENATGYLSIYLSGSTPTDEPVTVTVKVVVPSGPPILNDDGIPVDKPKLSSLLPASTNCC